MSGRKTPHQPQPDDQTARVDDTLVHSYQVRQEVHELLRAQQVRDLSVEEAHALAENVQKLGPDGIQALFDCLFDEENSQVHRLAVVLLSEMETPEVCEKARHLLQRPNLPEKVRVALLAVEALHEESSPEIAVPPCASEFSVDTLLQMAESFWEEMEMEEISMMWQEHFASEPAEERLAMLEALMSRAHPKLLGVARLEIALGHVKTLQFLAQKLGQFYSPVAKRMLESLYEHPDLVVRTLVDVSLSKLRNSKPRPPRPEDIEPPKPRFYQAFMATDQWSGHYSLVYSVRTPDGLIKFFVALLDRWDRGIVDCWGSVRYSKEEFRQLLDTMARDFADLHQQRIKKDTALTLLHKAMGLNLARKHPLPLDMHVWIHLIESERFRSDPAVPEFGVDCSVCNKPVRTGKRTPSPWVVGDLVVCHRCAKRSIGCKVCKGKTTLGECFLTSEEPKDLMVLRCPHCFESIQISK